MATTLADIVDGIVSDVRAITPETHSDKKFDRCPRGRRLADFATTDAAFRKFEIVTVAGSEDTEGILHPGYRERLEQVAMTIAYPSPMKAGGLYRTGSSPDDVLDAIRLMRADARQIYMVLREPTNYGQPSHIETVANIDAPDTTDENMWFQTLTCSIRYFEDAT